MNRQEILDMVAGKELNAIISKEIFKHKCSKLYQNIFDYSESMDSAMLIVELLRKNGVYLTIDMDNEIYNVLAYSTEYIEEIEELEGESLPLLICKIALLCNMYEFVTLEV